MNYPKLIFSINSDISSVDLAKITSQLFITKTFTDLEYSNLDGYTSDGYWEYDGYIIPTDGYIIKDIRLNDRVLVLVDYSNIISSLNTIDIGLYISHELVYVEDNKTGPPGLTFSLSKLTLDKLTSLSYKNPIGRPSITAFSVVNEKSIDVFGHEIIIRHNKDNR